MTPAQQGFRADNPTTAQIDDGLVVQFKLPALDRLASSGVVHPSGRKALILFP
ncbi:response regulator [Pseudomonas aeruginosa]|nr:response regulator [Pseudomonas aeruginosa]